MFNGNYLSQAGESPFAISRIGSRVCAPKRKSSRTLHRRRSALAVNARVSAVQLNQPGTAVFTPVQRKHYETKLSQPVAVSDSDSILALYMREVGEVPLLTPSEEVRLAACIKRGDQAARDHMIRANLRFVIKIAREYENLGMPLLDLINEGNIGLMKAVEKFDPAKGSKLSTYAALWIKQQIRRALASQGKTIRLPIHVADKIYHLTQAEIRLQSQLGREATDEELAEELQIKVSRLARLRHAAMRPGSLDAPLGNDRAGTVAEIVADENTPTPFEQLRSCTETRLVRQLVEQLTEREARIISFRFGLDGGEERTLEDVGRRFKLTRERIRQLQNLALQKLRQMLESPTHFPLAT